MTIGVRNRKTDITSSGHNKVMKPQGANLMTYFVGQTITIPQTDDWEAHTAEVIEIADDILCVMTEHGEYGEIEIEMLDELSA